MVLIIN